MARKSWKSLVNETQEAPVSLGEASLHAPESLLDIAARAGDSRLPQLLKEREALEGKMKGLMGGSGPLAPQDNPRFPVASFAQRMADQQDWENGRERPGYVARTHSSQNETGRAEPVPALRASALEQRLSDGGISRMWQESAPASALNKLNDKTRLPKVQKALRHESKILKSSKKAVKDMQGSVNDYKRDLKDLDKKLADHDVSKADREEIRGLMGGKQINKVSSALSRADNLLNAPKRAADKIDGSWGKRRKKINGAMDKTSNYADRRRRRLSTESGGSGDLLIRMAQARQRALEKRQKKQKQQEVDQRRRDRAVKRKREKDKDAKRDNKERFS